MTLYKFDLIVAPGVLVPDRFFLLLSKSNLPTFKREAMIPVDTMGHGQLC